MRCPKCTSIEDKVIDSRISKEGSTIRRRRECLECGYRYSTTEVLVRDGLVVLKRDGRREDFDRDKLIRAIRADPRHQELPVLVQTSDPSVLDAPVFRELQVSQLMDKRDFIEWLVSRVDAHVL